MTSLKRISEVLFDEQSTKGTIEFAIAQYRELVQGISNSEIKKEGYKNHLHLENGIAIGLKWAATCLDDTVRTHKFIRGAKLAIKQKLSEGRHPVHVLYAGTGPFATLVLPLLAHFTSEELQVSMIEVNPESVANVEHILKHFGFEHRVKEIICADATSVILPNTRKGPNDAFDVLLSETMQHALQAELQVPICANLLNQLSENVILIPQSIQLDVTMYFLESGNMIPVREIGEFMKVDADFLRKEYPINEEWEFKKEFDLSGLNEKPNTLIGIDTTISVFGEERIGRNESGLTVPKIIGTTADFEEKQLSIRYAIVPEPNVQLV